MSRTQVIMTFIHAGGAGKTSTTRDIGAELARRGKRVLLVDLDPQANLTEWLGVQNVQPQETVQATLERGSPLPQPRQAHGMDLIPAHLDMIQTEAVLTAVYNAEGQLRQALKSVVESGQYDYILLDAPPSLGKITANGGNAANWLIIPLPATRKGLDALRGLNGAINMYSSTNPNMRIGMYLMTQLTNTNTSKDVVAAYEQLLPADQLTGSITQRPAVFGDCQLREEPIGPSNREAYSEVVAATDFMLGRMEHQA
ncbi:ParA family protein [Deinococcus cavernae]|uniref:ParA family protein n=1 Tax=Deinococcus cavernae TaxID=2320857 RepID=A0A418VGP5_9DEIO|nr:ParA family protein [Deinococcus cavernae]RJF75300.1 ParA family protein [Deinococcus cavernae]